MVKKWFWYLYAILNFVSALYVLNKAFDLINIPAIALPIFSLEIWIFLFVGLSLGYEGYTSYKKASYA